MGDYLVPTAPFTGSDVISAAGRCDGAGLVSRFSCPTGFGGGKRSSVRWRRVFVREEEEQTLSDWHSFPVALLWGCRSSATMKGHQSTGRAPACACSEGSDPRSLLSFSLWCCQIQNQTSGVRSGLRFHFFAAYGFSASDPSGLRLFCRWNFLRSEEKHPAHLDPALPAGLRTMKMLV